MYRLTSSPTVIRTLQVSLLFIRACAAMGNKSNVPTFTAAPRPKVTFPKDELRARLSPEEYRVTQDKGTERAWTG